MILDLINDAHFHNDASSFVGRIATGRSLAVIVELVGCVLFWNDIFGSSLIQLGENG